MKSVVLCCLVSHLIVFSQSAPLQQRVENDPELTAGYFEGDMILDLSERNALRNESRRWPDRVVPYVISDGYFKADHITHIKRGMQILEEKTCIRFRPARPDEENYILITGKSDGCYSNVGFLNRTQGVNFALNSIDVGCFRLGTIVHEFLHTLGIYHQQSAANRDDYVDIVEENIQVGTISNFYKYNDTVVDDFGEEYDYGSVMHYSAYAFSSNGKMTIVPKKEGVTADDIGQRRGMSKSDIRKVNIMYRCPLSS